MKVEPISFSAMKDLWRYYCDDETIAMSSVDPQQYCSNRDYNLLGKYTPTFYAIKEDNVIVAALAGHRTTDHMYRVRGLFLDTFFISEEDHLECTRLILKQFRQTAKDEGCTQMWSLVNDLNHLFFQLGFTETDRSRDNQIYCISPC